MRSHFQRLGLLDDRVIFVEGWFQDTMPALGREVLGAISILRLDGDYYTSTMDILTNIYEKVSAGGFVIVDDYFTYEQCADAVNDFRASRNITDSIVDIDGAGIYWRKGSGG